MAVDFVGFLGLAECDFSQGCSHVSAGTSVVLEFDWLGYLRGLIHMVEKFY